MSDFHGSPHRTATPSEEKARCNKAFLQIDDESQKNSLHVCRVPKLGDVSLIPPNHKVLQLSFECLLAAPLKILRKNEVITHE